MVCVKMRHPTFYVSKTPWNTRLVETESGKIIPLKSWSLRVDEAGRHVLSAEIYVDIGADPSV